MKRELNKKIISICEEAGSSAAAEKCGEIMDELDREYDKRIESGMTELDAYRDVMKRLDKIKKMVDSLPKDDECATPEEIASREDGFANLKRILDETSTVMWLVTVLLYFIISFISGKWALTWVIFLISAAAQVLLGMVEDVNDRKKNRRKVIRDGASGVMWIMTVVLYFVISYFSGKWAVTWLIFVAAAIVQTIVSRGDS